MKKFIYIVLAVFFLSGCQKDDGSPLAQETDCPLDAYTKSSDKLYAAWADAFVLTEKSPRVMLPAQIDRLQSLRRDFASIEHPQCVYPAHAIMTQGMKDVIDGFLEFLAQGDDDQAAARIEIGEQYIDSYNKEIVRLKLTSGASAPGAPLPALPEDIGVDVIVSRFTRKGIAFTVQELGKGLRSTSSKNNGITLEIVSDGDRFLKMSVFGKNVELTELMKLTIIAFPQIEGTEGETGSAIIGRLWISHETLSETTFLSLAAL